MLSPLAFTTPDIKKPRALILVYLHYHFAVLITLEDILSETKLDLTLAYRSLDRRICACVRTGELG